MNRRATLAKLGMAISVPLLGACSPEQAFTPRLTSDALPPPTPVPSAPSEASLQMTAEQGMAVLIEAWARLIEFHVDQPDPVGLLQASWEGLTTALPAGHPKPAFPTLAGDDPQADLRQFRSAYLAAAAPAAGGVEGQENLAYAGVQRMCQSLRDCNTSFVDAHQLAEQAAKIAPNEPVGGVGIRIKRWGNEPIVIWELLEGGAAGKAGVKAGDAILSVDGTDATKMTLDQLASSIRGRVGTSVKLTVEHPNGKKQDFTIKRSSITEPVVRNKWLQGDIGYFRILSFTQPAHTELLSQLASIESKKPKGWIFDLRLHSGGDQRSMLATLSKFLKDGPFGYEVDRLNRRVALGPDGSYLPKQHPLALLVGDATSSHAELFAAAIQHYKAGTLVGTKTAGCLGVANRFQLNDGSALSVTTKKILGPAGQDINKVGVTPKEVVEVTRADLAAGKDPQLQRALAVLGAPSK